VRRLAGQLLGLILAVVAGAAAHAASPFADWSAAVIAGDYRSHSGASSEVFDNARRDIAAQLPKMGFQPQNVLQFSIRPQRYPKEAPKLSSLQVVRDELSQVAQRATGGCLIYYTSHGAPGGLVMTTEPDEFISPMQLNRVLQTACPDRPVIIVLSACFSGSFIPGLAAGDRMILTAARPDRASFGCGDNDRYPFFDACVLERAPVSKTFIDLAAQVQGCVASKEREVGARPPSEPQVWIGPALKPLLPLYVFPSG
jgi:hypothetical protein